MTEKQSANMAVEAPQGGKDMQGVGLVTKEAFRGAMVHVLGNMDKYEECPKGNLDHMFAPGVYYRQIFMPAGSFVLGRTHKTEHLNIILRGCADVYMNGQVERVQGPCGIKSIAGVQKVLFIHEDMEWATIHPTNETDMDKLEAMLVIPWEEDKALLAESLKQLEQVGA